MGRLIDFGFRLLLVCGVASLGLAGLYSTAEEDILENERNALRMALAEVLGTADGIEETVEGSSGVYRVKRDDGRVLYAARGGAQGYSSVVQIVLSAEEVDGELRIVAMRVMSQQETPGLGTVIADQETSETFWSWIGSLVSGDDEEEGPPVYRFLKRFRGKTRKTLRITSDKAEAERGEAVLGISGATISSDATLRGAQQALERIRAERAAGR
jgi:Na+-translocating ferredoxin:NAD+ oxidoreductase RnfG subunit